MAVLSFFIIVACFCYLLNPSAANQSCRPIKSTHMSHEVDEGTSLTLPCVVSNDSNFYWYGDNTTLYANEEPKSANKMEKYTLEYERVSNSTGSSNLTIKSVHRSDPGTYKCRTRLGGCTIDRDFSVVVRYPATINAIGPRRAPYWTPAEPGKIFVNETENITLSCDSGGKPLPSIKWTKIKREGDLIESMYSTEETEDGDLSITNVSRTQSGIYRCQSTNQFGTDTADVDLVVQYAPEVEPSQTHIRAGPRDAVAIGCDVTSNPEPLEFYWLKDDVRIFDDDGGAPESLPNAISLSCFSSFIRFVIFKLDPNKDYGNYTCVATNPVGISTTTIEISGRPLAPVIVSEEVQGRYGFYRLIWKISEDNSTNIPVSLYVIQYRREDAQNVSTVSLVRPDEALSASSGQYVYFLEELTENSSYVGQLCPVNDYGTGDCTAFKFRTSEFVGIPPPKPPVCDDPCVHSWVAAAEVRHPSVTMVTISAGIVFLFILFIAVL